MIFVTLYFLTITIHFCSEKEKPYLHQTSVLYVSLTCDCFCREASVFSCVKFFFMKNLTQPMDSLSCRESIASLLGKTILHEVSMTVYQWHLNDECSNLCKSLKSIHYKTCNCASFLAKDDFYIKFKWSENDLFLLKMF